MSYDVCERVVVMSPTNVLFRQFVASCLVFAGMILSFLRLGQLASNKCVVLSVGESDGVCVRTEN